MQSLPKKTVAPAKQENKNSQKSNGNQEVLKILSHEEKNPDRTPYAFNLGAKI